MKRNKSKWSKVIVTNLVSSQNLSKLQPLYAVDLAVLSARAECSKGQNVCGHGPHVVQSLLPASICSHPFIWNLNFSNTATEYVCMHLIWFPGLTEDQEKKNRSPAVGRDLGDYSFTSLLRFTLSSHLILYRCSMTLYCCAVVILAGTNELALNRSGLHLFSECLINALPLSGKNS